MSMIDHALPQRRRGAGPRGRVPRRQGWYLPYLIILPAVVFELAIHIIPMLTGIWMSFKKLTKFFIANWSGAPDAVSTTTARSSTCPPRRGRG